MNSYHLNRRLWKVATIGVPTLIVFILIGFIAKAKFAFVFIDILGFFVIAALVLAVISDIMIAVGKSQEKDFHSKK